MTDQELERRLARAIFNTAPDDLQGVLSRCETRKGNVIPMTTKRKNPWARNLIAACLALALVGGAGVTWQQANAVASVVSLDVNPSIELNVNKNGKVLSCEGLNEEARDVLTDMNGGADLKGTELEVAVNAIVGALVRSGYLDSISSAILISVEDADQTRAARLRQELTAAVDGVLQKGASEAAVLSQTVEKNSDIEKQARENNISTGKAALISRIMTMNSSLTFDGLSALSVEELKDLAETGAPGMPIGREEAARSAMVYAAVTDRVISWETDAELDERTPHYEVELRTAAGEFEYEVDAYTGAILRGKANVLEEEKIDQPPAGTSGDIGSDEAKTAALSHAGLTEAQVTGLSVEKDEDDGRVKYEVEFRTNGMEYEYTIDAATGAVLEHEKDRDD